MKLKYFGTDGVRGRAFEAPLRATDLTRWGAAWGRVARRHGCDKVVLGWDPRDSSLTLARAFAQGASRFVSVQALGMIPTPAVALRTVSEARAWGVMLSASHNPPEDNGIKGFDGHGEKLDEAIECELEEVFECETYAPGVASALRTDPDASECYVRALAGIDLADDVSIVLDCAHGATAEVAPQLLRGRRVRVLGAPADGARINVGGGATNLTRLRSAVLESDAALGIAFDGDGDRCLLIAPDGSEVDGDQLLWLLVQGSIEAGERPAGVVGTVMSNAGLEHALASVGVQFVRTPVGDKFLSRELRERGWELASEASGHLIHRSIGPTGDGLATAIAACRTLLRRAPEHRWDWRFEPWPLTTVNVRAERRMPLESCDRLAAAVARLEADHRETLRLIVRWSGTEPKLRLTAESRDEQLVHRALTELEDAARADLSPAYTQPPPAMVEMLEDSDQARTG